MSYALLFSGQGTQHPLMLPWVDSEDALLKRMHAALGVTDWRQAMTQASWAARNRNVQLLLTAVALSAWHRLSAELPAPAAIAGYSVGELAAFAAAGVFDAGMAIRLAAIRAEAMDRCATAAPGGLIAVGGLGPEAVGAMCARTGAAVAIRVAVDSVVLGGDRMALQRCAGEAARLGGRCTALPVEVPSHTVLMQPAADAFAKVLAREAVQPPTVLLLDNVAAEPVRGSDEARRALSRQIASTVLWSDCVEAIHARRVACVLEVGPGAALASAWNRRYPEVPARSADEFGRARSVAQWLAKHL